MKKLGRSMAGFLPDMLDYTHRLSRRTREYRLARLLSGWPALVAEEETPVWLVAEPVEQLLAYRGAA